MSHDAVNCLKFGEDCARSSEIINYLLIKFQWFLLGIKLKDKTRYCNFILLAFHA